MLAGQCLCGAVRYEIDGRISIIWFCHCSLCRKSSGSAFNSAAVCPKAKFRWLGGEDQICEYQQSDRYRTRFCRTCGSPCPLSLADSDLVWLPVGTLTDDPVSRPAHHIFVDSKAAWFEIHDDLPQHPEHAPGTGGGGDG